MIGFLELRSSERRDILTTLAPELGYRPEALEKDIGICWALEKLSSIEQLNGRTALKGGTSLSKVFHLIDRFSEDIDLTVDYLSFLDGEDPDLLALGRNERDRLTAKLKKALLDLLLDSVVPRLERLLPELSDDAEIEFRPEDELIILKYPSVLESRGTYLKEEILLEFGARNVIQPSLTGVIEPLIGSKLHEIRMPTAVTLVLMAERTFWEKATLVHVACNRGFESKSAERQSRHWYDLAMLSRSIEGTSAMSDRALLADVIRIREPSSTAPRRDTPIVCRGSCALSLKNRTGSSSRTTMKR